MPLVSANGAASYQPAGNAPGIEIEKQKEGLKARAIFPGQQNLTQRPRRTRSWEQVDDTHDASVGLTVFRWKS